VHNGSLREPMGAILEFSGFAESTGAECCAAQSSNTDFAKTAFSG
jgi:hypothetical protein